MKGYMHPMKGYLGHPSNATNAITKVEEIESWVKLDKQDRAFLLRLIDTEIANNRVTGWPRFHAACNELKQKLEGVTK